MSRPGADAGPTGHRDLPFSITVDGRPRRPTARADATGDTFLNFLGDPRAPHRLHGRELGVAARNKRAYDPENVFGLSHNIAPAPQENQRGEHPVERRHADRVRSVG